MSANHNKQGQKHRRWWTTLLMFPFFQIGPILPGIENDDQLDRLHRLEVTPPVESQTVNSAVSGITPESISGVLPFSNIGPVVLGTGLNIGIGDALPPLNVDLSNTPQVIILPPTGSME